MEIIGKTLGFDPVAEARAAERAGYDGVRVIDHFFSGIAPEPQRAVSHGIAGLAAAAAATERALLTTTMLSAPIRHPVECAQAIATIDRISGGRAELGLGGGWNRAEFDAVGIELGSPRDRVDRLIEAATICRRMFEQKGVVDFEGRFFLARTDAEWPATPHVPDVMVAAGGRRATAQAAAVAKRVDLLESMPEGRPVLDAEHVNSQEHLAERVALARAAAERAGNSIRLSATVMLVVTADAAARDRAREELAPIARSTLDLLEEEHLRIIDTGDGTLARLQTLAALGFDRLHIRPADERSERWLGDALPDLQALEPRSRRQH
jgi:alkanesulfonate monooxygenase SsuD/methylene tetrahydromethanopterin reductase-like flavin-dependent oxidoreductase (luciferase family)